MDTGLVEDFRRLAAMGFEERMNGVLFEFADELEQRALVMLADDPDNKELLRALSLLFLGIYEEHAGAIPYIDRLRVLGHNERDEAVMLDAYGLVFFGSISSMRIAGRLADIRPKTDTLSSSCYTLLGLMISSAKDGTDEIYFQPNSRRECFSKAVDHCARNRIALKSLFNLVVGMPEHGEFIPVFHRALFDIEREADGQMPLSRKEWLLDVDAFFRHWLIQEHPDIPDLFLGELRSMIQMLRM